MCECSTQSRGSSALHFLSRLQIQRAWRILFISAAHFQGKQRSLLPVKFQIQRSVDKSFSSAAHSPGEAVLFTSCLICTPKRVWRSLFIGSLIIGRRNKQGPRTRRGARPAAGRTQRSATMHSHAAIAAALQKEATLPEAHTLR